MGRYFTNAQKAQIWLKTGGTCILCGVRLGLDWHADHRIPFNRGGPTKVLNGDPLCPTCNLRKGSKMPSKPFEFRPWQFSCDEKYWIKSVQNFLIEAFPGCGKTIMMLWLVAKLWGREAVKQVIIVVPSVNLKTQWRDVAKSFCNLELNIDYTGGPVTTVDFHGIVVTYAQLDGIRGVLANSCQQVPTVLVADEIHHAGTPVNEDVSGGPIWGGHLGDAFSFAKYRILGSGTPFRHDGNKIAFVDYDDEDCCAPSFKYSYNDGLRDGILRPIFFPTHDARASWDYNGQEWDVTFEDDIPQNQRRNRNNTILNPELGWFSSTFDRAHQQLMGIRAGNHPEAGGLIICKNIQHAKKVAAIVKKKMNTNEDPIIVTSEDGDPDSKIEEFKNGRQPWLIAVRMVSEGVDIKRLRVGVYATNWITQMFFDQFLGRFARQMVPGRDEPSFIYLYPDGELVGHAKTLIKGRDAVLLQLEKGTSCGGNGGGGGASIRVDLSAEGFASDTVHDDDTFTRDELINAMRIAKEEKFPNYDDEAVLVAIARMVRRGVYKDSFPQDPVLPLEAAPVPAPQNPDSRPKGERIKDARKDSRKFANRLAYLLTGNGNNGGSKKSNQSKHGSTVAAVQGVIAKKDGVNNDTASLEQLERKCQVLRALIARVPGPVSDVGSWVLGQVEALGYNGKS